MFVPNWIGRKRQREEDEGPAALGFSEHRIVSSVGRVRYIIDGVLML